MRKSRFCFCLPVLFGALLGACNDDDTPEDVVTSKSSATADFSSFSTFAFVDKSDVPSRFKETIPSGIKTNLDAVNDAMRTSLTNLGLKEVSSSQHPDLTAFSLATTSEQTAVYWDCVDGYWYGYWSYTWDPCAWLVP